MSNPQSVDISLVKQTMIEFPTLTFCPQMYMVRNEGFYPEAYNFSSMKNCGLKFPEFESEHWALPWIGNCTKDYKNFWKSIENKWEDFKVNYIKIQSSLDYLMLSKLTPTPFYSHLHGVCYSWEVPRDVIEKGIQYIEISAGHKADFVIFFHSKGLLNNNPRMSLEYAIINMISKSIITVNLNFKQLENLDYNGEKCEQNPNYDFNKCLNEEIFNESMKILNCTTPYGPNKDHICDSTDLANQAIGIYSRKNLNYIYACILAKLLVNLIQTSGSNKRATFIPVRLSYFSRNTLQETNQNIPTLNWICLLLSEVILVSFWAFLFFTFVTLSFTLLQSSNKIIDVQNNK